MNLLMCPKCRDRHVTYYRVVDLAECQDCFYRFHLRTTTGGPEQRSVPRPELTTRFVDD